MAFKHSNSDSQIKIIKKLLSKKFCIGWYESKMSHNSLRITNAFFFTNLMKLQKLDLVREESSLNWIEFFPNLTVIKGRLREIKLCQSSSEGTTWKIFTNVLENLRIWSDSLWKKSHAWINPSWIVHYKRRFTLCTLFFSKSSVMIISTVMADVWGTVFSGASPCDVRLTTVYLFLIQLCNWLGTKPPPYPSDAGEER